MKIRKGQGHVTIEGLTAVLSVKAAPWEGERRSEETWPVLRTQYQTVRADPAMLGEGRPVRYVQTGEDLYLFPVPDGPYWLEVTYHGPIRRA